MPFPLIPIIAAAGLAALALAAGKKGRTAARVPDEDLDVDPLSLPVTARPGYTTAKRQYDFVMGGGVTDPGYLRTVAGALQSGGFPELAEEVLRKLERLTAGGVPAPTLPPVTTPPTGSAATAPPPVTLPSTETDETGVEVAPAEADEDEGGELAEAEPSDGIPRTVPAPPALPPAPPPPVVPASAIPPVTSAETATDVDPKGTVLLARMLIARETGTGWKEANHPEIAAWQGRVGLTPDGKFGTGSALMMGEEVGILPRIRYFSTKFWRKEDAVEDARARIRELAARIEPTNAAHAMHLRISADAETGQGWPQAATPIPNDQRAIEQSVRDQMTERLAEHEAGEAYGTRTTAEG